MAESEDLHFGSVGSHVEAKGVDCWMVAQRFGELRCCACPLIVVSQEMELKAE